MKSGINKSVMTHQFSQVPQAEIQRSKFRRCSSHKTTFDAGYLIPVFVDEVLPGDTFNLKATLFARLATPVAPIMDNLVLDVHYFAVPLRLVWENFQKFMGEQEFPDDSVDYEVPHLSWLNDQVVVGEGSIYDYMGVPVNVGNLATMALNGCGINALFFRAYNLIWNTWYRDQNLQDSVTMNLDDGPDSSSAYSLLKRGKRHDYFTSCLPWPQKGDAVAVPLTGDVEVQRVDNTGILINNQTGGQPTYTGGLSVNAGGGIYVDGHSSNILQYDPESSLVGVLSEATSITINSLREAFQLQKLLERDARGGTRYTEIIRSHFGVVSPDARLQRPEFLGGSSVPVVINPVAQTSVISTGGPLGDLAGFGVAVDTGNGFVKSFTEHSIIIGLVSARADLTYQQGLHRMFSRKTKYDFYWPALAHLGEQAVLNQEIYFGTSYATNLEPFGYQERYAEYRYAQSRVSGLFRSKAAQPLDFWHLSQEFDTLPELNDEFIEENPPVDRVIAVPSEPHFIFDSFFDLTCARPMPLYGVPGLIDHF